MEENKRRTSKNPNKNKNLRKSPVIVADSSSPLGYTVLSKLQVIVGVTAVGKTFMCQKFPALFVDGDEVVARQNVWPGPEEGKWWLDEVKSLKVGEAAWRAVIAYEPRDRILLFSPDVRVLESHGFSQVDIIACWNPSWANHKKNIVQRSNGGSLLQPTDNNVIRESRNRLFRFCVANKIPIIEFIPCEPYQYSDHHSVSSNSIALPITISTIKSKIPQYALYYSIISWSLKGGALEPADMTSYFPGGIKVIIRYILLRKRYYKEVYSMPMCAGAHCYCKLNSESSVTAVYNIFMDTGIIPHTPQGLGESEMIEMAFTHLALDVHQMLLFCQESIKLY